MLSIDDIRSAANKIPPLAGQDIGGVGTLFSGNHCLEHALKYVDDLVTVSDEEIAGAMRLAWSRLKLVVEPGGASSLAAEIAKKIKFPTGSKVACIFSGVNVNLCKLSDIFK